jgi:hypothetical protein
MHAPPTQSATTRRLQEQVDNFNTHHPIGADVSVLRDNGDRIATKIRFKAEVLGGHSAVIWLEGISGCYLLDRVSALQEHAR